MMMNNLEHVQEKKFKRQGINKSPVCLQIV